MTVDYRSDGTGRDTYIVANSGGLKYDYKCQPVESMFKNSLRNNEKIPFKRNRKNFQVDITDYMNWISPRGRLE